jgi:hypothetical protein
MYRLLTLLLLSALAFSQTTTPAQKPSTPAAKPHTAPAAPAANAEVAPSAAVITIDGLCNGKVPATPSPDCRTVITRAAFEKLVDALDPNMPQQRRQQLADVYSRVMVMSDVAEQRGLQNTAEAQQVLDFSRMQTLTQLLVRDLQKEAAQVPPAETEKYYNDHQPEFEQGSFQRLFIPKTPPGGATPLDEKTLQAEADKIHAAAVAGGDFEKLQKQAYDDLGIKTPPPPTAAGAQERQGLPPGQQKVFDLQPGQISEVLNEPGGYYILRLESKKKSTLSEATPAINRTLGSERMKAAVEQITDKVKPSLNQDYFGPPLPGGPGGIMPARPAMGGPPRRPPPAPPASPPPAKPPGH